MARTRVTVTLDRTIVEEARLVSGGNFSRFVSRVLQNRLEALRRQRLRDDLRAGYESEAANDLEIAGEYDFVDAETARGEDV